MKKDSLILFGGNSKLSLGIIDHLSKKFNLIILYNKNKPKFKKKNNFKVIKFSANDSIEKLNKKLLKEFQSVVGIVHFNGIHNFQTLKTVSLEKFNEINTVNCFTFINCIKICYLCPNLHSLVSISSVASKKGAKGISLYASSKSLLNSIVKSAAKELANKKIRVNSIILGHMEDGMSAVTNKYLTSNQLSQLENEHLLGFGKSIDLYYSIDFLLDKKKSRWITGTEFLLDGGYLA